jgi:hypothetical protein
MSITIFTTHFGTDHAMGHVLVFCNHIGIQRLKIAWPATTSIKLGIRGKQRCATAHAVILSSFPMIPIAATERMFSRCLTGDAVLNVTQGGLVFLIGFLHGVIVRVIVREVMCGKRGKTLRRTTDGQMSQLRRRAHGIVIRDCLRIIRVL